MKTFLLRFLWLGLLVVLVLAPASVAKPPKKSASDPAPVPTPATAPSSTATPGGPPNPLAHWLLLQNGGKDALSVPLAEVIRAATGKNVLASDPANPADAAMIAKLGTVMDRILPGMNRSESPAHVVNRLDEVAAFFEDALGSFNGVRADAGFPAVRLVDPGTGKAYYLGVALYPTGGMDAAVRAVRVDPVAAAARVTDDGTYLLVGVEYNGKIGKEIAFLNWELIDVSKLPLHVATLFDGSLTDAHPPGAVLNDGRKGRD